MGKRNIIVIGASAGGFEPIKKIISGLPQNFNASIFIVWHMSPDVRGILPDVLNRVGLLPAGHAIDMEPIRPGHIYVAPPDHHLLIEKDKVHTTRGPKENRFRPAIDPLFRSAAFVHGPHVIGVILSGALDDGTAGLWMVKHRGGLAVVQDTVEAEVPSMPKNAARAVKVDYETPVSEMPALLVRLCSEDIPDLDDQRGKDSRTEAEISYAMEEQPLNTNFFALGELTPYTCPECHGVLLSLKEGNRVRFRCHTGHAFSADSLLATVTEQIEESLWNAIRSLQESVILLNHMGDHFAEANQPKLAAMYFKKAKDAEMRANKVREAVMNHEQLSTESISREAHIETPVESHRKYSK